MNLYLLRFHVEAAYSIVLSSLHGDIALICTASYTHARNLTGFKFQEKLFMYTVWLCIH